MSARDMIAAAVFDPAPDAFGKPTLDWVIKVRKKLSLEAADRVTSSLTEAGYRILGPGELDPVTVERCAKLAKICITGTDAAHCIRSLSKEASHAE